MSTLIQFFTSLGGLIGSLVDYVVNFFKDLVWLVRSLAWAAASAFNAITWIPEFLQTYIILLISIIILYKVLGREG